MLDYTTDKDIAANAASSIIGTAKDAVVATGADLIATLYNSTVGLVADDMKTQDVLTKVDRNALAFYNEHKDGVEAASFLAGLVAPQVVSLKLLAMAKNGASALGKSNSLIGTVADTFSGTRSQALQTELRVLFENGKYDTPLYNRTMRQLYANKIGENTIDAALFEGLSVATLNAHPFMEDYMESPYQNFALWAGVGGAVGGALGVIGARNAVRAATGDIATTALSDVATAYKPVNTAFPNAAQVQTYDMSIRNLNALISNNMVNPLTKDWGNSLLLDLQARRAEHINEAAPWLLGKDGKPSAFEELRPVVEKLLAMPEMLHVDHIKVPNMNFIAKKPGEKLELQIDMLTTPSKESKLQIEAYDKEIANLKKKVVMHIKGSHERRIYENALAKTEEVAKEFKETNSKLKTVFYRPSTGELFDRNLAGSAARAIDIKGFKVNPKTVNHQQPGGDFFLEQLGRGKASGLVDGDFLNELAATDKLLAKDIKDIGIAPDNLPRLNAFVAWQAKLSPELRSVINYNVVSDLPSFIQNNKFIESGAAGVKPTYIADAKRIVETEVNQTIYQLEQRGTRVSAEVKKAAFDMLNLWQGHRDNARLRNAMSAFLQKSTGFDKPVDRAAAELIWNSGALLREQLKSVADAEGNIRLYRGIEGKVTSHAPVEGYTLNPRVASGFGTARLVKVPLDNVIGRIGGREFVGEGEILVSAPHYNPLAGGLDTTTGANVAVHIPNSGSKNTLNAAELAQHFRTETERQIRELTTEGTFTFEEIASRTNVTREAAQLVASGRSLDEIPDAFRYTSSDLIDKEYLHVKNKILALQGDKFVADPVKLSANLDDRFLTNAHQQFVEFTTAKHHSSLANDMLNFWHPENDITAAKEMRMQLDSLRQNIGEINNALIKNPMFQSVDMSLRNIRDGALVTYIGKRVSDISDAAIERILKPVGASFQSLKNNQAAIAEFNAVDNKLLSLSGWRDIRVEEETGWGYIVQRELREGKTIEVPVKNVDGSVYYFKQPEVMTALEGTRSAANEVLRLHNLNRELRGQAPLNDLGFYLPPTNLVNKFFSYVVDNSGKQGTSLLIANSAEELKGLEVAYKQEVIAKNPTLQIVTKEQQKDYNLIQGYMDGEAYTVVANNQMKHSGSIATAIVPADARRVDGIMQGFEQQIIAGMRKWNEMYLHDITQKLDSFSKLNQQYYGSQPQRGFFKSKAPEDAALTVKNTLLANNNLNQFTTWKSVNEFVDMSIVRTAQTLDGITSTFQKNLGSEAHFNAINTELETKGIKPVWESFDLYRASLLGAPTVNSRRAVAAANGLLGTFQLRLLDLAHPLVNALSTPILASAALKEGLPGTILPNGERIKFPLRIMYDAARFQFNPKGIQMIKEWEAAGHLDQAVRQFTDIQGKLHTPVASKGASNQLLDTVESFQNSRAVELLTKPADFTEKVTRQFAMAQGYLMAKHAYPGISDRGATIYAVALSDRIIGNYHAAQRPSLFQGSFGAVIGLYQTYMTTFAQHVYRGIEQRQFQALATSMLSQAGIFGMSSWPGYDTLSKFIGLHMSNQNYDLTTGTYRAVGDTTAELVLYGLPSMLGPSLYTRGDISPRIPTQFGDLAIVNTLTGVYNATAKMVNGVATQPGFGGKLQSVAEALSLQTLSRPIARASEIVMGESITKKGQTVATSDDVWTYNGIFSRMLSVRPLEEQVTRNALHLNSFYGAADHEARQEAVGKLRTAIRAGNMNDELVENVATVYLRKGGSNKGWNSVMNEIMSRTEEGTAYDLLRRLEPDSPLRRMIKDTF